jgi:tRNA-specific 2-thiouridylase
VRSFAEHLNAPSGKGALAGAPYTGAAGGAACGDLVRIAVRIEGDRIAEAGFDADGCGATTAAASAIVENIEGEPFLSACRLSAGDVAEQLELGPAKRHAADLAADALHRALGAAAKDGASGRDGAPRVAPSPRRTLVAMSGGVDSAAAAQLALDAGDEVVAVTLELWADPATDGDRSCCSPQAVTGARQLAHGMGIPHLTLDLRERFRAEVVDLADALGAARLATGHYARVARDERGPLIRAAADPAKDQSYMLAKLDPALLDRLSFPLGGLTKEAVRQLARDAGLPVADKRESQDLCFVAGLGGRAFLQRHGGPRLRRPGEIVDRQGRVLGTHEGHHNYTVGQRRGLGIATPEPVYVLEKDATSNRVIVGPKPELATRTVTVEDATLHRSASDVEQVRLRYHAKPIPCRAFERGGRVLLELASDAHAVAPGQLACLMRQDRVVGEGTIGESK